jgi:hypothetical protein
MLVFRFFLEAKRVAIIGGVRPAISWQYRRYAALSRAAAGKKLEATQRKASHGSAFRGLHALR